MATAAPMAPAEDLKSLATVTLCTIVCMTYARLASSLTSTLPPRRPPPGHRRPLHPPLLLLLHPPPRHHRLLPRLARRLQAPPPLLRRRTSRPISPPPHLHLHLLPPSQAPIQIAGAGGEASAAGVIPLYRRRAEFHPYILLSIYCLHMYLALELVLAAAAIAGTLICGIHDIEPQFDEPYRSASLGEFWGRRWNLMVAGILRPSVYLPVRRRFGPAARVVAALAVSGVMHEVVFYYVTAAKPTGEVVCFFVLHGGCVVAERWVARRRRDAGERKGMMIPAVVGVPATIWFLGATGYWLFFPQILRSGADEVVVEECLAAIGYLESAARAVAARLLGGGGAPAAAVMSS